MDSVVYDNSIVLRIVLLMIVSIGIIGNFMIILNQNMIMLMIVVVVGSIFTFVTYYMRGDVSNENFKIIIVVFLILIVIMLSGIGIMIFLG